MNALDVLDAMRSGAIIHERPRWVKYNRCQLRIGDKCYPIQGSTIRGVLAKADFPIMIHQNLFANYSEYMALEFEDTTDIRWIVRRIVNPHGEMMELA